MHALKLFQRLDANASHDLFATFGSESMSDFILNWAQQVRKVLPGQPFVVGALDNGAEVLCKQHGLSAIGFGKMSMNTGSAYWRQNERTFLYMAELKAKLLIGLLRSGYNVMLSDADVAWLSDPWGWVHGLELHSQLMPAADVIPSTDIIELAAEPNLIPGNREFNTGVVYWANTSNAIDLVIQWHARVKIEGKVKDLYINDQAVFNRMVASSEHTPLNSSLVWPDRQVYKTRSVNMGNVTANIAVFPMNRVLNGHAFFVQRIQENPGAPKPFAVHWTYQFADEPAFSYGKRHRARQAQFWNIDAPEYYSGNFLALNETSLLENGPYNQSRIPIFVSEFANKGGETGIELQLEMETLQRQRLSKMFAIAIELNRTLILPQMLAFCDRYWWTLNSCRLPGSEFMSLPRHVPLDHLYDIGRFYDQNLQFREALFLKNAKFENYSNVAYVSIGDVDKYEVLEKKIIERVKRAFSITVKLCPNEQWFIAPGGRWDPASNPLNCSNGYSF